MMGAVTRHVLLLLPFPVPQLSDTASKHNRCGEHGLKASWPIFAIMVPETHKWLFIFIYSSPKAVHSGSALAVEITDGVFKPPV